MAMPVWTYSDRVRIVGHPGELTIQCGDPNDWNASVEWFPGKTVEEAFAELDRRRERGAWPFDKPPTAG